MTDVSRRQMLLLLGGGLAVTANACQAADVAVKSLVAFGDSYTQSFRNGVPSWVEQIRASGDARLLVNLGYSGATTEGRASPRTLDGQVDLWVANYRSRGLPDRTVVYFGYNDVAPDKPLSAALNQYHVSVNRLISYGVSQGSRRLILCQLHDWSRNPSRKTPARSRVRIWNQYLVGLAAMRPNVVTVNLFAKFEDVYRNKSAYGFTNVTAADRVLSETTYLYADGSHFGRKGCSIIAKEIRPMLL